MATKAVESVEQHDPELPVSDADTGGFIYEDEWRDFWDELNCDVTFGERRFSGIPTPVSGLEMRLVGDDRELKAREAIKEMEKQGFIWVNSWTNHRHRTQVEIFRLEIPRPDGTTYHKVMKVVLPLPNKIDLWINTLAATMSWKTESEHEAQRKLESLITP